MARKITPIVSRANAKTVGLKLPLTALVAKATTVKSKPARAGAAKRTAVKSKPAKVVATKRTPLKSKLSRVGTAKRAAVKRTPVKSKPVRVAAAKPTPVKPTPARNVVVQPTPVLVVKKIATPSPKEVPASRPALALPEPAQAPVQPALKLATVPSKAADTSDNLVESRDMIATFENCGAAAAKGAETLGKEVVNYARGSMQAQFALAEALMKAKTVQEVLTAQNNYTQDRLGRMTAEISKFTGMSMALTESIMAPLQDSVRL